MKPWHQDDSFWKEFAPVLFNPQRMERTKEEVENIISLLNLRPGVSVLDLCCGPGRHSLELARRRFSVTGVDRTRIYLAEARKKAKKEGLEIDFIQKDMRSFCKPNSFDVAINFFTSFGYFEDEKDDKKVLENVYRSLKKGGVFLIDTVGKEVLARRFQGRDWYEINDIIILEEGKVCKDWTWVESHWIMIKDGKKHETKVTHRLYSAAELSALLKDCGFNSVFVYGDLTGAPYDDKAKRLILAGHKGK